MDQHRVEAQVDVWLMPWGYSPIFGKRALIRPIPADLDELPPGRVKTVTAGVHSMALTHIDAQYAAMDNRCPHQGGPLGEGSIEVGVDGQCWLRCPWHGWDFDPRTGLPPGGHDDSGQQLFPVEVRDGKVFVSVRDEDKRMILPLIKPGLLATAVFAGEKTVGQLIEELGHTDYQVREDATVHHQDLKLNAFLDAGDAIASNVSDAASTQLSGHVLGELQLLFCVVQFRLGRVSAGAQLLDGLEGAAEAAGVPDGRSACGSRRAPSTRHWGSTSTVTECRWTRWLLGKSPVRRRFRHSSWRSTRSARSCPLCTWGAGAMRICIDPTAPIDWLP